MIPSPEVQDQTTPVTPAPQVQSAPPVPPGPQDQISLSDNNDTPISLSDGVPSVSPQVAALKADKIHTVLGDQSPGKETIASGLQDGNEGPLRRALASSKDVQDKTYQKQALADTVQSGDTSDEAVSAVKSLATYVPQNSPDTVIERAFANHFVNDASQALNPASTVARSFLAQPEATADKLNKTSELVAKQEVVKTALLNNKDRLDNESYLGQAGDLIGGFLPGKQWYSQYGVVKDVPDYDTWIPLGAGSSKAAQFAHLYTLNPEDMHRQLTDALQKMNPHDAQDFLEGMVSYSASDQFLGQLGSWTDIASVLPLGTIAKVAKAAPKIGSVSSIVPVASKFAEASRAGAEASAARVATGVAEGAAKPADTGSEVIKTLQGVVRANADMAPEKGDVLTAVGNLKEAAVANTEKRVSEVLGDADPMRESVSLNKYFNRRLSSLFNPELIVQPGIQNFSAQATDRLVSALQAHKDNLIAALNDSAKIARAPEEALQTMFRETQDDLAKTFRHVDNSVLDYTFVRPEESSANVGAVEARLGKPDATAFGSHAEAYNWGTNQYGLVPQSFRTEQRDGGFYIVAAKHLDETTPTARAALLTTNNQTPRSFINRWLGFERTADDKVSDFQNANRKAAVFAGSQLDATVSKIAKDARDGMSRSELRDLKRVMQKDQSTVDPVTMKQGKFSETLSELNDRYMSVHSRIPSEAEARAYFTMTQLNDFEWVARNQGIFRDKARLGLQNILLRDTSTADSGAPMTHISRVFDGKFVDSIPYGDKADAGVIVHTAGEEPRFVRKNAMSEEHKSTIKDLQDQGYKIIQTDDPNRKVFGDRFGEEPVSFIVTKDFESKKLDWDQLKSYRPGWHSDYAQQWFVKQPMIKQIQNTAGEAVRSVYQGDKAAFGFNTQAEATRYAGAMETARVMMNKNDPGLRGFLEKSLPYSEEEFRSLFAKNADGEATFSSADPFLHTYTGRTTVDTHGNRLKAAYPNLEDNVRSPYNLMNNVDKKYLGERDEGLRTVAQSGTEQNPVFKLQQAQQIDPMSAMSSAMANVVRSRYFTDYKTQAVEAWAQEFGHLLRVDPEQLKANPVDALHHAAFNSDASNAADVSAAKLSKEALLQLIGTKTDFQNKLEAAKQTILDSIFTQGSKINPKFGQESSNWAADKLLNADLDPLRWMRKVAFTTQIGLFNPIHMFQNAATMANVLGVAGATHAVPGFAAGQLMNFMRYGDQHIDTVAKIAESMGFKADWFKEAFREMQRSGINVVGGEHAWKNDFANPQIFTSKAGDMLDKTAVLFHEGERMTRLTAYATAFREFRTANPDQPLTAALRNQILNRADLLSGNMTRASIASWQNGVFSVPGQFLGYMARLSDQMLGQRLTPVEKARVMAYNSLLYGVPVGVGGATVGQVWNPWQDVENYATDHGIDVHSTAYEAFNYGLSGLMSRIITGHDTNVGQRVGPGGNSILRDIIAGDQPFKKILLGASGSKLGDILSSADPFLKWSLNTFKEDDDKTPLVPQNFEDLFRNIALVDHGMKTYYAYNSQLYLTKRGNVVDKGQQSGITTPSTAWFETLTGGSPKEIENTYVIRDLEKTRSKAQQDVVNRVSVLYRRANEARGDDNEPLADAYSQQIRTYLAAGGFTPDERAKVWNQITKLNIDPITKQEHDFAFDKAPPNKAAARQKQFFREHH